MVRSAVSDPALKKHSKRSKDITDIMRPTAGVIDFSPAASPLCHPSYFDAPSPHADAIPSLVSFSPESTSDDAWNLVPYHISWGHDYQDYHAGRLPGPEGDCIFLRSPTPLKNQRTTEACRKCRERKAKCSGGRPSCVRCETRGFACEYASEASEQEPVEVESKVRRSRRVNVACAEWGGPGVAAASPMDSAHSSQQMKALDVADAFLPVKTETPLSYGGTDSPLGSYFEGVRPDDLELIYIDSAPMSYANSPSLPIDSHVHGLYDGAPFPYDSTLALPHSIIAPQPIRRQSMMSFDSSSSSSSSSPYTSSSGSEVSVESYGVAGSASPDGTLLPMPSSGRALFSNCEAPLAHLRIDTQAANQFLYMGHDTTPAASMEGTWLHSPRTLQSVYPDSLAASPLTGGFINSPHAFPHFS